jgi:hypothetical protein
VSVPPPEQPTTEAGRAAFVDLEREPIPSRRYWRAAILAIEAEARAAERRAVEPHLERIDRATSTLSDAYFADAATASRMVEAINAIDRALLAIRPLDAVATDTPEEPERPTHPYNGGTCCGQPLADHAYASVEWVAAQDWYGPVEKER